MHRDRQQHVEENVRQHGVGQRGEQLNVGAGPQDHRVERAEAAQEAQEAHLRGVARMGCGWVALATAAALSTGRGVWGVGRG